MNKIIDVKKKYELLNILILGFFLIILGIILIFQKQYYGSLFIIVGFLIVTFKKGLLTDIENKRIKNYKKIAFKIFGEWESVSDIQYIALSKVNLTQQMYAVTVPGTFSDVQVKLSFVMNNKKILPIIIDKKSKIFRIAKQIAIGFKTDIFDNSEGEKKWIKNAEIKNDF